MKEKTTDIRSDRPRPVRHFRAAVAQGLAALVPPLLTVLIVIWVINTTQQYVLEPIATGVREALVWATADIRQENDFPDFHAGDPTATAGGKTYRRLDDGSFVPETVYDRVRRSRDGSMPGSAKDVYRSYVVLTYLRPYTAIPFFLALFILLLYLLGKFMAIGMGRFFWGLFEQAIHRLPLVRSVYSAVKQVTEFFFRDQPSQFRRVVAVEYPRMGMWSLAFVTSDGFQDIRDSVGAPVVGLFIPTSPMPMNGYALTVRQSEVVDLRMTIDEAIQFIVSCGLVIPTHDLQRLQADRDHAPPASSTASETTQEP